VCANNRDSVSEQTSGTVLLRPSLITVHSQEIHKLFQRW